MTLTLQALIRAAGVYIKLEFGYERQAAKMAGKAREVLATSDDLLRDYFDPAELLAALAAYLRSGSLDEGFSRPPPQASMWPCPIRAFFSLSPDRGSCRSARRRAPWMRHACWQAPEPSADRWSSPISSATAARSASSRPVARATCSANSA